MEFLFFVPFLILLLIAMSMIAQGWMIVNEKYGYTENPGIKGHPEMRGVRKGDGLMTVNFIELPDEDYSKLNERIQKLKLEELFDDDDDGMAGVR
jgi:hypothetical protein